MKCPFCAYLEDKVVEPRESHEKAMLFVVGGSVCVANEDLPLTNVLTKFLTWLSKKDGRREYIRSQ